MGDVYTMGTWTAKDGEEDEFIAAWEEFVRWGSSLPGSGTLRLTRDLTNPLTFVSFADWDTIENVRAWKSTPEFKRRMAEVQQHVAAFKPLELELVSVVDAKVAR